MRRLPILYVLFSGLMACSSPGQPSDGDPSQELAQRQQQFDATVGGNYRVTFANNCFCPLEAMEPVRLTVRDGAISEVTRLSDGTPVPASRWFSYRTVDDVFAEIGTGLSRGARRVEVDYDSRYGYPKDVLIDYLMAADNFLGFKLSDLETVR